MKTKANKTAIQKAPIENTKLFYTRELNDKHFDMTWHSHDEYQLFLVLKGKGTRFIGNTVKSFDEGDLTFLGPGIPHLWKIEEFNSDNVSDIFTHGIVVYINPIQLEVLSLNEEFQSLASLLEKVKLGMEIYGETRKLVKDQMQQLQGKHGMPSVIQLLNIFEVLSHSKEYHLLREEITEHKAKEVETDRINTVYNYAAVNFKESISLEDMANLVNMTPTSFSRFFKNKTSKSFIYFLTELRIKNACKLLAKNDNQSISDIGYDSGFNTLSNFNKQFKAFTGLSPKDYKEKLFVF
jgi:AraC-like DNA-binding protein